MLGNSNLRHGVWSLGLWSSNGRVRGQGDPCGRVPGSLRPLDTDGGLRGVNGQPRAPGRVNNEHLQYQSPQGRHSHGWVKLGGNC